MPDETRQGWSTTTATTRSNSADEHLPPFATDFEVDRIVKDRLEYLYWVQRHFADQVLPPHARTPRAAPSSTSPEWGHGRAQTGGDRRPRGPVRPERGSATGPWRSWSGWASTWSWWCARRPRSWPVGPGSWGDLIRGSYRDQAVLRAAGVPAASALVVTEDDDVGNLHAALAAQELNPALRMRLRMFNRELGRRVQELFEDCQVFDSAALAVPAFVSAALLQDWQQRVEVDGRTLVVRRAGAGDPGVLLPLARVHPDGTAELFPEGEDEVLCLAEARPAPIRRGRHPERHALEQPGRVAPPGRCCSAPARRLRVTAAIVLELTVTGIAIFWWFSGQDLDLIDAIYFTVTIMTTTGFGDIHLRDAPPPLQLYGVALMLSGTAALAILFALITDALISARLARVLGANIPAACTTTWSSAGWATSATAWSSSSTTWSADRRRRAARDQPLPAGGAPPGRPGAGGRHPPARDLEVLHVGRARSVVVVTSSDIVNLETALNIQALNPDIRVVLRLFDPDLAARVERAFGFHISRSPSALAPRPSPPPRPASTCRPRSRSGWRSWPWPASGSSRAAGPRAAPWPSWRRPPPRPGPAPSSRRRPRPQLASGRGHPAGRRGRTVVVVPAASSAASSPGPRPAPPPTTPPPTAEPGVRAAATARAGPDLDRPGRASASSTASSGTKLAWNSSMKASTSASGTDRLASTPTRPPTGTTAPTLTVTMQQEHRSQTAGQ